MFIDDSQAQAILRNALRDAQDAQNRSRINLLTSSIGKGKKRNKKNITQYFSELNDGTNQFIINTFKTNEKHFTAGALFVDPVLCKYDGLGNVGRLVHQAAGSKSYVKKGSFYETGYFIAASEHFMIRSIQRMKKISFTDSLSVCGGLLRMIAKSQLTLDSYPQDTYLVIDGFAIPLSKFSHNKLNFSLLVLKTVLCKDRMTTNQLDFFGNCFEQINAGKSSIILIDHNGNILSQLSASEYSLTDESCSLPETADFLYLLDNWANTKEIIESNINNNSIEQIENNMIETSKQLSESEGLVLLSKSELSKKLNDGFKSVVPKGAYNR